MSWQAVRCVFEHLAPKARGPAQHVLLWLANHAHDDGGGIWAAQGTIAREAGISRRTVQRAQDTLEAAGMIEVQEHGYKHGVNLVRIVLCALCATETQEGAPGALYASERRRTRVRETHKPIRNPHGPPGQRALAALTAELNLQASERPPNGDGQGYEGRSAPSRFPDSEADASESAFKPSNQAREATAGAAIPFKARPAEVGAPGGAARTQSRDPPSGARGEPVSNPRRELRNDLRN